MNIVEEGQIFSQGEDGEKADKVIVSNEINIDEAEPSHAEAQVGAGEKDDGVGLPTSTQVS